MVALSKQTWRQVIAIAFLFLAPSSLLFPSQGFGSGSSSASKISIESKLAMERVPAGSTLKVAVLLKIEEGWHINSNTPTHDYLIGTALELQPKEGVILADLTYPHGEDVKFAFSDEALNVYEGTVPVFLTLRISDKLSTGLDTLHARLRVQACNDQICLSPSTINVAIPIEIVRAGESSLPVNDELFSRYTKRADMAPAETTGDISRLFDEGGSFGAFLAIFLVGLALNLTPCVYPMMSVTVSLFGAQTETNALKVFLKAVTYVLGISAMYTVLGVSAALSGGLFGSWLQSPWVLGGIGMLLIGLALSSFGLYQIQMPYWLTSRLGGATGTGLISLFISGLVVGVFAAPCIGPPVIALLTLVSSKADPVFGFWVFFTLSIGLGFPYLILGTFSGMIKKIPRSGAWLIWVERLFGVILTAAGLFYFSLAFFPKYSAYVVPLALIAGGIYLGFVENSGKEKKGFLRLKWVFGVLSIGFGIMTANALREPGIEWEAYSGERLAEARQSGTPVMMDFYADWCIPCLELDRKTFVDAKVIEGTKDFVRLKVDLTHFDSPESEALRKQFTIAGVPTIVFLDRNGEEVLSSRVIGYLPPKEFLERVQAVVPIE